MANSDRALNSAFYLRQASEADPDRPELASVLATIGVGHALLAIAEAINDLAEATRERNERS